MIILVLSLAFFIYCIVAHVRQADPDPSVRERSKVQGDIVLRFVIPWIVLFVFMAIVQFLAFYMSVA